MSSFLLPNKAKNIIKINKSNVFYDRAISIPDKLSKGFSQQVCFIIDIKIMYESFSRLI